MRPKNYKRTSTVKKKLSKCEEIAKLYDRIQVAYAEVLERDESIIKIQCNVLLTGVEDDSYTTDFLCQKDDGDYCVRECVFRKKLLLPKTARLLDVSHNYWSRHGITDWAIVVEKEDADGEV